MASVIKAAVCVVGLAIACQAAIAQDHSAVEPRTAHSLADSIQRLARDHGELQDLLSRDIIHADLAEVHHLTYSLQETLSKIEAEVGVLQEKLKEVQLASERGEQITTKEQGQEFLDLAVPLVK